MGSDVSSSCFFSTSSTLSSELCFESVEAILNFRMGKRTNCNLGVYFQSHAVLWTSNVKAPISLAKPGIKPSQVRHQRFPYFLNVPGLATMRIDLYRCELISNWTTQICHKTGQNFQKKKRWGTTIHTLAVQGIPCQRTGAQSWGVVECLQINSLEWELARLHRSETSPLQSQAQKPIKLHQKWFLKAIVVGRKIG